MKIDDPLCSVILQNKKLLAILIPEPRVHVAVFFLPSRKVPPTIGSLSVFSEFDQYQNTIHSVSVRYVSLRSVPFGFFDLF